MTTPSGSDQNEPQDRPQQYPGTPAEPDRYQPQYPYQYPAAGSYAPNTGSYPGQQQGPQQSPQPGQSAYPTAYYPQPQWSPADWSQSGWQQPYYPGHTQSWQVPGPYGPPPVDQRAKRRRTAYIAGGVTLVAAVAAGFTVGTLVADGHAGSRGTVALGNGLNTRTGNGTGGNGSGSSGGTTTPGSGSSSGGGIQLLPPNGSGSSAQSLPKASTTQETGVVDIDTNLKYQGAEAAGTGLVLNSDGVVLTNNHVIEGATSIKVRVVSTGRTYTAHVVGDDPTKDIAVLQMTNASGLTTANFGDSTGVAVGDQVTGVGNAEGLGGTPSAASGDVVATDKSIKAASEDGSAAPEHLHGMFVTNAHIEPGDSGGPLYNASGQIVGIDTAASSKGNLVRGFAIPIDDAMSIANEIRSGVHDTGINYGNPGFLGLTLTTAKGTPRIDQVIARSAAARAGLRSGDVITGVNQVRTRTATQLHDTVSALSPGTTVTVYYRDPRNRAHSTQVTLEAGPAL